MVQISNLIVEMSPTIKIPRRSNLQQFDNFELDKIASTVSSRFSNIAHGFLFKQSKEENLPLKAWSALDAISRARKDIPSENQFLYIGFISRAIGSSSESEEPRIAFCL